MRDDEHGARRMVHDLVGHRAAEEPFEETSVNPARSLCPAVVVGGDAIKQVWLFIVAPLIGGVLVAFVQRFVIVRALASEPEAAGGVRPSDVASE